MAEYKSWLPQNRVDVLVMVRIWLDIMGINLQPWGIPQEILQELTQLVMEAQAALDAAPPTKRTKVLTAKVVAAFNKLVAKMRFIKERYFLKPPLTDADFVALGLVPKDTKPTPAAWPWTHILTNIHYEGYNTAVVSMEPMPGDPPLSSPCRKHLVKGVMPRGGATLEQAAGPAPLPYAAAVGRREAGNRGRHAARRGAGAVPAGGRRHDRVLLRPLREQQG